VQREKEAHGEFESECPGYCGAQDTFYVGNLKGIDHSRTKTKNPQTNGICERFNKTLLDEFCRVTFRTRLYGTLDELQADLDRFLDDYNTNRPHQGRWCYGNTPMQTFADSLALAKEKQIA
jgi:transposase InsO family protein